MNIFRRIFSRNPTVFRMGVGEILITHGTLDGVPVLGVVHAPKSQTGSPRDDASCLKDYMKDNGVFFQFMTSDSAVQMLENIKAAVDCAVQEKNTTEDHPMTPSPEVTRRNEWLWNVAGWIALLALIAGAAWITWGAMPTELPKGH